MIKHSFAVLAFKDSPFLSECISSLKNQTIESDIYISTSTPSEFIYEIAKKYNIKIFVNESKSGIANDWNFSLKQAKTKFVTLAHQDDIYLPDYTAECIYYAEKFKDTMICFTNYLEIVGETDRDSTLLLNIKLFLLMFFMQYKKHLRRKFWKARLLSFGNPIAAPSVLYNLEILKGFQFSNDLSVNMDWDAWYRLAKASGRFVYIKKVLMKHRIHSESATTNGMHNNLRQEEDLLMFKRFWPGFMAKLLAKFYKRSYNYNDI